MHGRTWLLYFMCAFMCSGCATLATIGHSGGKKPKPTRIDRVLKVVGSPSGDYVACIYGKGPDMEHSQNISLLLPQQVIKQKFEWVRKEYPDRQGDSVSIDTEIGPGCDDEKSQFDDWQPLEVKIVKFKPLNYDLSFDQLYPNEVGEALVYAVEKNDDLAKVWGLYDIILVDNTNPNEIKTVRFDIKTYSVDAGSEELALLPATIAVDSVTLPFQALWMIVSGVAMSGSH